jgi:hypothetical protein
VDDEKRWHPAGNIHNYIDETNVCPVSLIKHSEKQHPGTATHTKTGIYNITSTQRPHGVHGTALEDGNQRGRD